MRICRMCTQLFIIGNVQRGAEMCQRLFTSNGFMLTSLFCFLINVDVISTYGFNDRIGFRNKVGSICTNVRTYKLEFNNLTSEIFQ